MSRFLCYAMFLLFNKLCTVLIIKYVSLVLSNSFRTECPQTFLLVVSHSCTEPVCYNVILCSVFCVAARVSGQCVRYGDVSVPVPRLVVPCLPDCAHCKHIRPVWNYSRGQHSPCKSSTR